MATEQEAEDWTRSLFECRELRACIFCNMECVCVFACMGIKVFGRTIKDWRSEWMTILLMLLSNISAEHKVSYSNWHSHTYSYSMDTETKYTEYIYIYRVVILGITSQTLLLSICFSKTFTFRKYDQKTDSSGEMLSSLFSGDSYSNFNIRI